jgi:uncharacterized protein YecT (DUF1311 family)
MRRRRAVGLLVTLSGACCALLIGNSTGLGQTQAQMNREASRAYQTADSALNRIYHKLMTTLDPGTRSKLKTAQTAWIKFRDAEADFRASKVQGGSVYPMTRSMYLTDLTKHRTQELEDASKTFHSEGHF